MANKRYYVQAGKSITCSRGLKGEGDEVFPGKDFPEENVSALVARDLIDTTKPDLRTKEEIVAEREAEKKAAAEKAAAEKTTGATKK